MSTIQVRSVPDDVRLTLKARAAGAGQSLSEYLLGELTRLARQPTIEELTERLAHLEPVESNVSAAEILRAERNGERT